jgi:hypothetical protein
MPSEDLGPVDNYKLSKGSRHEGLKPRLEGTPTAFLFLVSQGEYGSSTQASVQVMYRTSPTGNAYAQSGYEASYGSYHIDSSSTFTFHIDGALVRTLIGKDLKRAYEISGNRLTVNSTDANEHWRVVWERY